MATGAARRHTKPATMTPSLIRMSLDQRDEWFPFSTPTEPAAQLQAITGPRTRGHQRLYGFETSAWLSQSSKRVSARMAAEPGRSVRSPSFAPK